MTEKDASNPIIPSNIYKQVNQSLRDIEAYYTQSIQTYVEELSHYRVKLQKLTSDIEALKEEEQKNLILLRPIEDEVYYHQKQLDKLNQVFEQKIIYKETLDEDYEELLDAKRKDVLHRKHKKELAQLLTEIEESETILLQQELQKINILASLEPIQQQIVQLENQYKETILDKEHYETTKASKIAMFRAGTRESKEVIDIDVLEEDIDMSQENHSS